MKKKIGAILAAAAMACTMTAGVAFSGCGTVKIPEFEMPEGGYDGSKVSITFANTTGQNLANIIADAIEDFNVLYPNITVNVDNSQKNYDTLSNNIATKIGTDKHPHVAFCYADHVARYNEANAVLAIDDFLANGTFKNMTVDQVKVDEYGEVVKDDNGDVVYEPVSLGLTKEQESNYVDAFFAEGKVFGDGKTYTLPFAKSTEVMYYNKDFFDAHPEIKVPTTWDEMKQTCIQIQGIIGKKNGKFPLGYDSDANLFITLCNQHNSPYTSASGKNHFLFNNDKNQKFVKDLVEWYNEGYLITQATNNDTYTSNLFTAQKCIMSIGSTGGSSYQTPDSTDGEYDFNVGVAPIPQVNPAEPKSILQGPSVCIFKKKNPQEVLASWLLVKFLTTNSDFQGRYSEASGYMPVTKSTYKSDLYSEFLSETSLTAITARTCAEMVDYGDGKGDFYTSDAFIGSSKARERVGILMKTVFAGGDINEAFKKAIKECNDYIS